MVASKTVMLVDDDAVSLEAAGRLLTSCGYFVTKHTDGITAIQQAKAAPPDLVLLDLGLPSPKPEICPVFDGFTVMNWLKLDPVTAAIPVIILSAKDVALAKARSLAAGALAYFRKPAEASSLLSAIRIALDEV